MSDKTPIQQAIDNIRKLKDRYYSKEEIVSLLQSLLPTEKEFVSQVYAEGWKDRDAGKSYVIDNDKQKFFDKYYKP